MKQKTTIPESIRSLIPCKCCRLLKDKNIYRVYKYSSVKLPSGKWSSDYGYLIGKIIPEEGFIPNKRYLKEMAKGKEVVFDDSITDVSYGQYALLISFSKDILEKLKTCFPVKMALQIYSYALILCANGFLRIDQIDDVFKESVLSVLYKDYSFKMGYIALSNLLHNLGSRTNPIKAFEQLSIDNSSNNIAIDGHVIRSCSFDNDFSEAGYKFQALKAPQVNLLIGYDLKNQIPLMYRTYRGSSIDKSSVVELLTSRDFKNIKFTVDRGFYSAKVLSLVSENNNCYIIPVPSNNTNLKRIKETLTYNSGEFVYRLGEKESARVVYYEEQINETTRIIAYKDMDENNSKCKNYKHMIALEENGYTEENYEKHREWWGVYFLQTNCQETAMEVYSDYKSRWSIETYNNYIKNDADFNNLKIQDYYVQHGFDFIMLVTGLIHSQLNEKVKELKKPGISTFDVLLKARFMRMSQNQDKWELKNTRIKDIDLFKAMGFTPEIELL